MRKFLVQYQKKKRINDNWNSPPWGQWIIRNSLWKTRLCNLDQCVSLTGGIFRKAAVWAHRCGSWLHTPVRLGGFATKLKKKEAELAASPEWCRKAENHSCSSC